MTLWTAAACIRRRRGWVMSTEANSPGRVKRRGIGTIWSRAARRSSASPPTPRRSPGLLDPHVDFLLVGDSVGMVVYGFDSTLPVTLEMMIAHGGAVMRGSAQALIVVDLPFGGYQESPEQAFRSAARIMAETGLRRGQARRRRRDGGDGAISDRRGVPVMGHVGLMPQSVNAAGGFKVQGRGREQAERVVADADAIAEAGAFAIVVEGTVEPVARAITEAVPVPTIGIGASPPATARSW